MLMHGHEARTRTSRIRELHAGEFPRSQHTSVVFERLENLGPEEHLVITCDYEPETLRRQVEEWCPDDYRWTGTASGPVVWRADITRRR